MILLVEFATPVVYYEVTTRILNIGYWNPRHPGYWFPKASGYWILDSESLVYCLV